MPVENGVSIEGELEESSQAPQLVEQKAREKGWKPRDETDIPDEQWIDAREFLGRQPLYDRIDGLKKDLSRQSQKYQQDMTQISAHFAKMQQVEYDKAMKALKSEKAAAIEDGNLQAVEIINDEMKEKEKEHDANKRALPAPQVNNQALQQEFETWKSENEWFETDKDLQKEALAIGTGYAAVNPGTAQIDILNHVRNRMERIYPEKFEKPKKAQMESKVENNSNTSGVNPETRQSKGIKKSDLSEVELSVMRTLLKSNVLEAKAKANKITQEQQYLRDLSEAKELR